MCESILNTCLNENMMQMKILFKHENGKMFYNYFFILLKRNFVFICKTCSFASCFIYKIVHLHSKNIFCLTCYIRGPKKEKRMHKRRWV